MNMNICIDKDIFFMSVTLEPRGSAAGRREHLIQEPQRSAEGRALCFTSLSSTIQVTVFITGTVWGG